MLRSNLLQNATMTKSCRIKCDHPENFFTFHLKTHCTDFIAKDESLPNSPDLNPLDYCVWGAMLQAFQKLMVVTHSQEACTRNLYKVDLYKKLDSLTWFLVQDFSCTSFLHRIQHNTIPYKKLACT